MTTEAQMREQFYKRMDAELYDLFHSMAYKTFDTKGEQLEYAQGWMRATNIHQPATEQMKESPRSELTGKEPAQPGKQPPKQETAEVRENGAAEAIGGRLDVTFSPGDNSDPWDSQWDAYKHGEIAGRIEATNQMKPLVEACGKLTWEFATDGNYSKPMALVEHSKIVAIDQALATSEQQEKKNG